MPLRTLIVLMLTLAIFVPAAAAAPTATTDLTQLGLPELAVTVTDATLDGIPAEVAAGRYLVTVTTVVETGGGIEFARPAAGTIDAFTAALPMLHAGHNAHGDDHAMPASDDDHHQGDHATEMDMSVIYDAAYSGGAIAWPDRPAQIIVDLEPGEWVATGGADATQAPVVFEVTGEIPDDLTELETGATITMGEYVIEVTAGELISGPQIIRIDNIGVQPHFVQASHTEADVTHDEAAALEQPGAAGAASLGLAPGFTTTSQSRGTTMWLAADLAPGTYVLLCHFPDLADGETHSAHGMVNVVEIGR